MVRDVTTIEVSTAAWSGLNRLKGPGDTFDDIIRRLLALAGDDGIELPEQDEGYVTGDIALAKTDTQQYGTVLKPSLILQNRKAHESGDYEVAHLSRLKFDVDGIGSKPRARGFLSDRGNTLVYNDDKIFNLSDVPSLEQP